MKWGLGKRLAFVYGTLMVAALGLLGWLELKGIPSLDIKGWERILTEQSLTQMVRLADMKSAQLSLSLRTHARSLQSFAQGHSLLESYHDPKRTKVVATEFVDNSSFSSLRIVGAESHRIVASTLPEEEGRIFPAMPELSSLHLPDDVVFIEQQTPQDSVSLIVATVHLHTDTEDHLIIAELSPYEIFQSILVVGRELGSSGAIDILDSRGRVIASTDLSILWESRIPHLYSQAALGSEGMDTARYDFGQAAICAYRHIYLNPSFGWGLVVRMSQQELSAPILTGNRLTLITLLIAMVLAVLVSILVARKLTHPVRQLTRFAKEMAAGEYLPQSFAKESSEIGELAQAFEEMANNLSVTMADLKKAKIDADNANQNLQETMRELEHMVDTDRLTGTWNRRYFDSMIERELRRTERYGLPLSLMIFDIDHFKKVNDTYGHDVGDQVLIGITERVRSQIRLSDALIRWGGEEFILVTSSTTLSGATALAEKIRICISSTEFPTVGTVTISIGVAQFHPGESKREWITRADKLLYAAKHNGRNRVISSTGGGEAHEPFRLEWYERFQSGNSELDKEHKELFIFINCMMNSISNPKKGSFESFLPGLLEALEQHYKNEEQLMREIHFPDLASHSQEHLRLLNHIRQSEDKIRNGDLHPVDLMEFLIRQVAVGHIIGYDMQFFPLLRRKI